MMHARSGDWDVHRQAAFRWGLAPALLVLALITIAPAVYLVLTSLTPLNLTLPDTAWDFSTPLGNYTDLLTDDRFTHSVWVQVKLSAATVAAQLLLGLGVALLLNGDTPIRRFARSGFLIPMVLPPIVVGIIWRIMYAVDISPFHRLMSAIGLPVDSLITHPNTALLAIVIAESWEWFPFTMLMLLAALQMVPSAPIEAASIDGANDWQIFRYVVFPYIESTMIVAGLFRLIDSIKAFPLIFVLTDGGPGDVTEVTNYYGYRQAFSFSLWGYGSAIATLLVVGIFVLSWIIDRFMGVTRAATN
jgi:multiple sugar transport system permease protein